MHSLALFRFGQILLHSHSRQSVAPLKCSVTALKQVQMLTLGQNILTFILQMENRRARMTVQCFRSGNLLEISPWHLSDYQAAFSSGQSSSTCQHWVVALCPGLISLSLCLLEIKRIVGFLVHLLKGSTSFRTCRHPLSYNIHV